MERKVFFYLFLLFLTNAQLILLPNIPLIKGPDSPFNDHQCKLNQILKNYQGRPVQAQIPVIKPVPTPPPTTNKNLTTYTNTSTSTNTNKNATSTSLPSSTTPRPIIATDVIFSVIDCQDAFNNLQKDRALYAYYFAKAAWAGAKICFFQNSYQSPAFLYIILKALEGTNITKIANSYAGKIPKEDIQRILVYTANFLQNAGTFKSFGDSKFVPQTSQQIFVKFWRSTPYWSRNTKKFDQIWNLISKFMFQYEKPYAVLQFSNKNGTSGYYSKSCTSEDADKVKKILVNNGVQSQNNRLVKLNDKQFIVKVPSIDYIPDKKIKSQDGVQITFKYGSFRPFLSKMNQYLAQAQKYSANKNQFNTISYYLDHFKSGDMKLYRQSQKSWVKDQQPQIETNIGFIQTYQDPLNVRAEYEGFVAVVNKKQSALLSRLVNAAPTLLPYLPWGKNFQVQQFKKPDFTSLQVLAFGSSDIPNGINLPNYDDIRENLGFKNLNLGNNYVAPRQKNMKYYPKDIVQMFIKRYRDSIFVSVTLHELLGHGSGRLLREKPDFLNPLDNSEITTYYKENETWRSVFGSTSALYEQCRADSVALYLSLFPEIQAILLPDFTPQQRQEIVYILWYNQATAGVRGLQLYDADSKKWKQAHVGGRFAIYNVLKRKGGIVQIKQVEKDGKPSLQLSVDRQAIKTKGKEAMADFLRHLQIYKAIADAKAGTDYINQFLDVNEQYLKYKKIIEADKRPRRILIQPYLSLKDGHPVYNNFNDTAEDCIDSYVKNYREDANQIITEWRNQNQQFRYGE